MSGALSQDAGWTAAGTLADDPDAPPDDAHAFALKVRDALIAAGEPGENMNVAKLAERLRVVRRRLGVSSFMDGELDPVTPDEIERFAFAIAVSAFAAGRAAAAGRRRQAAALRNVADAEIRAAIQREENRLQRVKPGQRITKDSVNRGVAAELKCSLRRVEQVRYAQPAGVSRD